MLLPQKDGEAGRLFNTNCPKYSIVKSEMVGTCPATPLVTLEADNEIIKYITGK